MNVVPSVVKYKGVSLEYRVLGKNVLASVTMSELQAVRAGSWHPLVQHGIELHANFVDLDGLKLQEALWVWCMRRVCEGRRMGHKGGLRCCCVWT